MSMQIRSNAPARPAPGSPSPTPKAMEPPVDAFVAQKPEWIERSDKVTQKLLDIQFGESPEAGSSQGVARYDSEISVPDARHDMLTRTGEMGLAARIRADLKTETDAHMAQDMHILLDSIQQDLETRAYNDQHTVPFANAHELIFGGLNALLDEHTAPERNQAAATRVRKYAGMEPGYRPLCDILRERTERQMARPGMTFPSKVAVETSLASDTELIKGMESMLSERGVEGWQESFSALKEQLSRYDSWVREALLPQAREDFKLSPEAYQKAFESMGIHGISPEELASQAHTAFDEIRAEMGEVAKKVAEEKLLPSSDYHDVMKALKQEQIAPDAILPLYRGRLDQIEGIVREHDLVTLPHGETVIRLATPSEAAQVPSPQMVPPPLVNNNGEKGQFVLPLVSADGQKFDDFTYDAISWTVTAHEARPGHELQFDGMVDNGVSLARAIFAENSANIEGWGLYSEWMILPYMPPEGQLASLDGRLLRAARAFLDPELHSGKITPEEARHVLADEVMMSPAMVNSELQRYTVQAPAQACSYFYGYSHLRSLRTDTEKEMGGRFQAREYHDFILNQGLLPPPLLREAVEKFAQGESAA